MEIAAQIRQNAAEYSDFVSELHKWTREAESNLGKDEDVQDTLLENSELYKNIKSLDENTGNYYKKWDNFDVDKELENVDYAVEQSKKTDKLLKLKQALTLKEMGNEYYKKGFYKKALTEYTKSLSYDYNVTTLTNRALTWLKLDMYTECIQDSTKAIGMDRKCIKGYWRRAVAKAKLKDFKGSMIDFEAALVLEPGNKAIREDLIKVRHFQE